jgi:hypothetical protein
MNDDTKCVCGDAHQHTQAPGRNDHCMDCGCARFHPVEEWRVQEDRLFAEFGGGLWVTVGELKPGLSTESMYEKARAILNCPNNIVYASWIILKDALNAGETAEKRANALTNIMGAAILLLNPSRPEDGLLPAIRDVLQQLTSEREAGKAQREHVSELELEAGKIAVQRVFRPNEPDHE